MSLFELLEMIEAMTEEEQRQDDMLNQRVSWQTAHIMNSSGNYKKRIEATDLYKPLAHKEEQAEKQVIVEKFETPEAKQEYLENLMQKFQSKKTDGSL